MISESKVGKDIFEGKEDVVVFAINTEGKNDAGFAGIIADMGWPELADFGEHELGETFIKEIDGRKYCAIVCHSLEHGWGEPEDQTQTIKKCFDNIICESSEKIGTIAIGSGLIGRLSGADYSAIVKGMQESNKEVVLYGEVPELKKEVQEMTRENAREINELMGTIDKAVIRLQEYQRKGESVYVNFNGHKLYSCDITVDGAYKEVLGMTKEECENKIKQEEQEREKRIAEKQAKTTEQMDKWLEELKGIDPKGINEREFYEQVLTVIKQMEDASLTPATAEQLKVTLEQIGCMEYDKWKAQKELSGEKVEDKNIREGIDSADIGTAVNFVSQLLGDYDNARFSLPYMLEGGEKAGWVQQWLKNSSELSMQKLNIPYYKVAKEALMNWNGLSEEEAIKTIKDSSFEEIEGQVWAKGSMDYAVDAIAKSLSLTDGDKEKLAKEIYEGDGHITREIKPEIERIGANPNEVIMDTLFAVHDGWVKDNQKKFMARDKKHQHMPSELIGWKEAKADLLFIRPIFEAAGMDVNEEELEQVYNNRVKDFFLDRKIVTARNLSDSITQGKYFYPALENYGEVLSTINDPKYVDQNVIPAIEEKGIGNIEEVRKSIVSQIINNPVPEDVARLSEEEKAKVEESLGQEVDTLTTQRDELHQKNSIVQRIVALAQRRSDIKKEIEIEEQNKSKNIQSFED